MHSNLAKLLIPSDHAGATGQLLTMSPDAGHTANYRPRISSNLTFIEMDEGVLLDGLQRSEMIRGPMAQTILPKLIQLMDGSRTIKELAAEFPSVPEETVRTAVTLLTDWKIVDQEPGFQIESNPHAETLRFLHREASNAKLDWSVSEAYARLQSTPLTIVASKYTDQFAQDFQSLLQASGIVDVRMIEPSVLKSGEIPKDSLVLALPRKDTQYFSDLHNRAMQGHYLWMRVAWDADRGIADIGPVFSAADGCYDCFQATYAASGNHSREYEALPGSPAILVSQIVLEIIHLLALPQMAIAPREFRRFRMQDWDSEILKYPRVPGCRLCRPELFGPSLTSSTAVTDTALVFEEFIGLESRSRLLVPGGENSPPVRAVVNAESKTLPCCEQIPLPATTVSLTMPTADALSDSRGGNALSSAALAGMLGLTAGVREVHGTQSRRWAATAGNLGSVELFVVAANVDGLPQGVYFYQSQEHQLARLRGTIIADPHHFMRRVLGRNTGDMPDALILFSGAFHRLVPKYGSFGYRLINLDAGACLSQLRMIATAMGVPCRVAARCADDFIEEEFHFRKPNELCTAVAELGNCARERKGIRNLFRRSLPSYTHFESWKTASEFGEIAIPQLTEMLIKESRLTEHDLQQAARKVVRKATRTAPDGPITKMPISLQTSLPLGSVLGSRHSIRAFDTSSVGSSQLATALDYACRWDRIQWPEEDSSGAALRFKVLVNRVSGLEPAVYEYLDGSRALMRIAPALRKHDLRELLVQSEFSEAAVLVWIVGDLAAACERHGAFGHRQLLVRAGNAAHALWMISLSLGLAGSLVAGVVPGAARRILDLDGFHRASLLAVALGNPLSPQRSQE